MLGGEKESTINIIVSGTPKKYSEEFLNELHKKRIHIISNIILRLANENKI